MAKRIVVIMSLAMLLAGFLAFSGASVASAKVLTPAHSAHAATPNSCQDPSAELELHGLWTSHFYQCTGTHWVNDGIYFFYAGGWSGYIETTAGVPMHFCDGQQWDIFPSVVPVAFVYMSPTREPWC